MIYVVATTKVKPGQRDAYIAGHKKCIAETLKEKGCISYEGHTTIHDPDTYVVVERWETRDDLNAHGKAPHMKVWREFGAPLKAEPTVIEIITADKVDHGMTGKGMMRRDRGQRAASLDRSAGRHRRARFRRPSPAAHGDDGYAWPRIPARSGERRRTCAAATRWCWRTAG